MSEYVEEYLVALGYDLKSEEGQEYLRICQEMERRHEELVKSGKSLTDSFGEQSKAQQANITGDKEEAAQLAKLDDMYRQLHKTQAEETRVKPVVPQQQASGGTTAAPKPPAGRPAAPPQAVESPLPKPVAPQTLGKKSGNQKERIEGDREEINLLGDMEKTVRQIGVAWAQLEQGNIFGAFTQSIKGVKQFADMLDRAGSSAQAADKKSGNFKQTIADVLKTKGKPESGTSTKGAEVAKTAASGAEAAGAGTDAGAAAAGAAGVAEIAAMGTAIAAVAAAIGVATKEAYNLADGLAQASINVETMSRRLWITDTAAWQLNNTLSSMGKTTADLNDIALNPTLREQFQALQDYQKTMLQLPSDFQSVNDKWNQGVVKNNEELKLSMNYLHQMTQYYASKSWEPIFEGVIGKTKDAVNGLAGLLKKWGDFSEKVNETLFPNLYKNSAQGTAANYAPQTSSYTQYQGATVTYAPNINVTANSSQANDIAEVTGRVTRQSFDESALLKSVQGLNR